MKESLNELTLAQVYELCERTGIELVVEDGMIKDGFISGS